MCNVLHACSRDCHPGSSRRPRKAGARPCAGRSSCEFRQGLCESREATDAEDSKTARKTALKACGEPNDLDMRVHLEIL